MPLTIRNRAGALYPRQAGLFKCDVDAIVAGEAGDGVISGLGVSPQGSPDMTVAVAAGLIRIQGWFCFVSAQNVTIAAADSLLDRIDIIVVDWNGAVSRVAGTAAQYPAPPDIPANAILLAQVYVAAADTSIVVGEVTDKRVVVPDGYDGSPAEFLGSSLSATAATSAGSIGECGWTFSASGTAGAPAFQTSVAGRPGVLRSVTGATSGNNVRFHFGNAATSAVMAWADMRRMTFVVSIPTITTLAIKFGFGLDLSDAAAGSLGTAGAWVEYLPATSAKWRFATRGASVTTVNPDAGADVTAGAWFQFDIIRKQNGNVQFLKNGALAFEHSTNLPGAVVGNIGTLTHTLTAAARNLDHDFFGMNYTPSANRWS